MPITHNSRGRSRIMSLYKLGLHEMLSQEDKRNRVMPLLDSVQCFEEQSPPGDNLSFIFDRVSCSPG